MNPHPFLGMGGRDDVLVAGREAVKLKVKELLEAFGSAWKADSFLNLSASGVAWGEALRNRGGSR
jgi:hypothetical protein